MSKNKNKKKNNNIELPQVQQVEKLNSLTEFALGIRTQQNQIAQADTAEVNLRRYMLTNNRMLLSQLYVEIGLVQTLIDQPVDDAYAELPILKSNQIAPEEIEQVHQYLRESKWFDTFKQGIKWGRLYGGAGIFINTTQNPISEFRIDKLHQDSKIEIYAVDRWELNYQPSGEISVKNLDLSKGLSVTPYNLYGVTVHDSRVLKIKGKEAPSILSLQLMGWGMSEVERLLRSLNAYLKNQDLIFELLDEAKIDVYYMEGFNNALMQKEGTSRITKQVTIYNQIKNYLNALILDSQDKHEQKTMSFSGLPDMNIQNKQNIASDLKMPITKLFGVSSAGFNSGEDDIENYNSMLRSEIRAKNHATLVTVFKLACLKVLGFIPEDIDLEYPALRILSAEQEENVKNQQFNRLLQAYKAQTITEEEFKQACNKANLFPIEVEVKATPKLEDLADKEKKKNSKNWFRWKK